MLNLEFLTTTDGRSSNASDGEIGEGRRQRLRIPASDGD